MRDLWRFIGGAAAIDQPDQQRTDRHPCQLIPIEKRKSEQCRLLEIIKRHPQQADEWQQQQDPHGRTPALHRRLKPAFHYWNYLGSICCVAKRICRGCNAVIAAGSRSYTGAARDSSPQRQRLRHSGATSPSLPQVIRRVCTVPSSCVFAPATKILI